MNKNNENGVNDEILFNDEDVNSHDGISAWFYDPDFETVLVMWHNKFGFWTTPIGKVKPNETLTEALCGEMKDELGVDVKKATCFNKFNKTYYRRLPGEDKDREVKTTQYAYFITKYNGIVKNMEPDKHREIMWMHIDELEKETNVSDAVKQCFKSFKKYIAEKL